MSKLLFRYGIRKKSSLPFQTVNKTKSQFKGQKFLDILAPKPNVTKNHQKYLNLIEDFLQTNSEQNCTKHALHKELSFPYSMEDSISLLFKFHKEGSKIGVSLVSNAMSLCASKRDFRVGIQVHCLVIVNGFLSNVYIGSSLITFYGNFGGVVDAYQMFDEMPVRNVVSWSAMINGFAQENEVDMCLKLYKGMMGLTLKPNEFTFTSLLSSCMGSGCFGHDRSVHCQIIHMGFDSYIHVANALLSMYCKCGEVKDAFHIFENMKSKDLVSWNSMICGYGQQGHAIQAIELFEEMKKQRKVRPDSITFLGVLSSCRHAGFVKEGMFYFNSMVDCRVKPELDHYSCIVDLLGRARLLEEAWEFIKKMPVQPNGVIWGSLLMSCRLQGNFWLGIEAAENRLTLEPWSTSTHLQLVNLYASLGYWDQAARVQKLMKDNGLKRDPGYSWIEIKSQVFRFTAEDISMGHIKSIVSLVDILVDHMRSFGVEETFQ
ncbi:pentatricopeptide repeat-containing protein At2g37320 [Nicotiana tomentosiformis]|uniref:pentatricopeptide repeat-containing protein At2g37320 n=1 Tax=Nicotiana tomentosiformis TaxID=4098 RepID=UPI00051B9C6D|nr:pentatricopeptide repeat-containing protein At2g37320 [Nicotiana tomentosiformis]